MTRLTVTISDDNDISFLKEVLNRFGLSYEIDTDDNGYIFSEAEIKDLVKTRQDYLEGKTTARDWTDIEKNLDRAFN
ncbi:hypothetical protein [Mucilaginibacter sp.]